MAKLSAHGKEIGRINYTTYSKAYMQDGTILKNSGFGWKVFGKCKINPQEVYEKALTPAQGLYRQKTLPCCLPNPPTRPCGHGEGMETASRH
jgi:hypothetical protein